MMRGMYWEERDKTALYLYLQYMYPINCYSTTRRGVMRKEDLATSRLKVESTGADTLTTYSQWRDDEGRWRIYHVPVSGQVRQTSSTTVVGGGLDLVVYSILFTDGNALRSYENPACLPHPYRKLSAATIRTPERQNCRRKTLSMKSMFLGLCLLLVYTDHAHTIHRHIAAFAEALGLSELTQETGESTPLSPRSPKAGSNIKLASASRRSSGFFGSNAQDDSAKRNGGLSPAISTRSGRTATQVEKVQALSDFAPIHQRVSRYELGVMISWTTI